MTKRMTTADTPTFFCPHCDCPLKADEKGLCTHCKREDARGWGDWDMTPEEEDAAERAYENSRFRAEWDHYHPGEPCPDIELPHPKNST